MAFLTRHVWTVTAVCSASACLLFGLLLYPRNVDLESRLARAAERKQMYELIQEGNRAYNLGEPDAAREFWDQAREIDNDAYIVQIVLGVSEYDRGNLEAALDHFDHAHDAWENHADASNSRGVVRWQLGNRSGALRDLNEALALNPDFKRAQTNRGIAKLVMGDTMAAREDFDAVIAGEEYLLRVREAVMGLGVWYAMNKEYDQAEATFTLFLDDESVTREQRMMALHNRARVHDAMGETEKARRDREEYERLRQSPESAADSAIG